MESAGAVADNEGEASTSGKGKTDECNFIENIQVYSLPHLTIYTPKNRCSPYKEKPKKQGRKGYGEADGDVLGLPKRSRGKV